MDTYLIEQTFQDGNNQNHNTFTLKQISQTSPQQILNIILEKDKTIQAFSQQITKLKAQQIKSKKLISSLQQKIQKTLSSETNTSAAFMIASEFKNLLTTFMTNTIPSIFYDFAQSPKIYAFLVKKIMQGAYDQIQQILKEKLRLILKQLKENEKNIQGFENNQNDQEQLRLCLLNYFQNNFKQIFPCIFSNLNQLAQNENSNQTSSISIIIKKTSVSSQIVQKIKNWNEFQNQNSEEMKQFCHQLYLICIYMILQQSPWQFVFDQKDSTIQENQEKIIFTKKQFTCIDGFVKEGKQVIYVLKGLRKKDNSAKQYHYHPNIKNFVLPTAENQTYDSLDFQVAINIFKNLGQSNSLFQDQQTNKLQRNCFENQSIQVNQNLFQIIQKVKINKEEEYKSNCIVQKNDQSFTIQAVAQTQKSEIIESCRLVNKNQVKLLQRQRLQNCVINPMDIQDITNSHTDKQNLNNINCPNTISFMKQKHSQSHIKKQKHLLQQKGLSKKSKKQKNNSTIDLTNQKRKLSQKDSHNIQREIFEDFCNNINNMKNYQLPLGNVTHPKLSHKKKGNTNNNKNSTSRKCSVGKIVSQSIHKVMNGQTKKLNHINKQKISLSQHSTMLMKESKIIKQPILGSKDNFIIGNSNQLQMNDQKDKENIERFVNHLYEKPLTRPKRSMKIGIKNQDQITHKNQDKNIHKNQDKILNNNWLNSNNYNECKQQRPLILRQQKNNNCLNVGRLRQKYLIN